MVWMLGDEGINHQTQPQCSLLKDAKFANLITFGNDLSNHLKAIRDLWNNQFKKSIGAEWDNRPRPQCCTNFTPGSPPQSTYQRAFIIDWPSASALPPPALVPRHSSPCPLMPGDLLRDTGSRPILSAGQLATCPGSQSACQEGGGGERERLSLSCWKTSQPASQPLELISFQIICIYPQGKE